MISIIARNKRQHRVNSRNLYHSKSETRYEEFGRTICFWKERIEPCVISSLLTEKDLILNLKNWDTLIVSMYTNHACRG
jgi:hypothetical protein